MGAEQGRIYVHGKQRARLCAQWAPVCTGRWARAGGQASLTHCGHDSSRAGIIPARIPLGAFVVHDTSVWWWGLRLGNSRFHHQTR
jgi:hypothetical protein